MSLSEPFPVASRSADGRYAWTGQQKPPKELLANEALLRSLLNKSTRLNVRELEKGIYEIEQLIFLHDWCEEHAAWR